MLDYMKARYFARDSLRFASSDHLPGTARTPGSFNLYAYVRWNPIGFADPSGLLARGQGIILDGCLACGLHVVSPGWSSSSYTLNLGGGGSTGKTSSKAHSSAITIPVNVLVDSNDSPSDQEDETNRIALDIDALNKQFSGTLALVATFDRTPMDFTSTPGKVSTGDPKLDPKKINLLVSKGAVFPDGDGSGFNTWINNAAVIVLQPGAGTHGQALFNEIYQVALTKGMPRGGTSGGMLDKAWGWLSDLAMNIHTLAIWESHGATWDSSAFGTAAQQYWGR